MNGLATSSATARIASVSTPVGTPSRSKAVTSISVGEFPAPAPSAHSVPSICRAPAWYPARELAIPSDRFWWACPDLSVVPEFGHQRRHTIGDTIRQ